MSTKVSLNPGLSPGVIRKASLTWADPLLWRAGGALPCDALTAIGVSVYADVAASTPARG